jgi:hypothetical protein
MRIRISSASSSLDRLELGGGGEDDRELAGLKGTAEVRIRGALDRHERMFSRTHRGGEARTFVASRGKPSRG